MNIHTLQNLIFKNCNKIKKKKELIMNIKVDFENTKISEKDIMTFAKEVKELSNYLEERSDKKR